MSVKTTAALSAGAALVWPLPMGLRALRRELAQIRREVASLCERIGAPRGTRGGHLPTSRRATGAPLRLSLGLVLLALAAPARLEAQDPPEPSPQALERLLRLAEQGDAAMQYNLGIMYARGEGVPEDAAEAVRWLRMAAEQGHAQAQYALGTDYSTGGGSVPRDNAEALRWFRMAAEQGHAEAQLSLGIVYSNGAGLLDVLEGRLERLLWLARYGGLPEGIPEDPAEAMHWFRMAADQGHVDAEYILGIMYANAYGVTEDDAEAARWFRMAADQGHASAQYQSRSHVRQREGCPRGRRRSRALVPLGR